MESLEQLLGFRVSGNPDSCLDHRRIEILDIERQTIKGTRPATVQEVQMWDALLGHEEGMKAARQSMVETTESWAQRFAGVEADNRSLAASCEAYRKQQDRLFNGVKHIAHVHGTDDAVDAALSLISTAYNQPLAAEAAEKRRHGYIRDKVAGEQVQK